MKTIFYILLASIMLGLDSPAAESQKKVDAKSGATKKAGRRGSQNPTEFLDVFFTLDLSRSQETKLQEIARDFSRKLRQFGRPQDQGASRRDQGTERKKLMGELQGAAYEKALALLTTRQRKELLQKAASEGASLSGDVGKTVSAELLERVEKSALRARRETPLEGNWIDALTLPQEEGASDEIFVRRTFIDLTGATPTVDEVLIFLSDKRVDKRALLIDALLSRPAYADYQALHWCDILRVKSEFPIKLWPNAVAVYHRWVRGAMLENMPYDQFARELLTASGSNFRDPPANFFRAVQAKDAGSLAEAAALAFMGVRTSALSEPDQAALRAFFEQVGYKPTSEWKEEIVYWNRATPAVSKMTMPDGAVVSIGAERDPRRDFADWLIDPDNEWFARAAVNRIWYWIFGTGIVHEPDDFRPGNPPSNPELLDRLAVSFIESGYDFHELYRLILSSKTYQQAASGYPVRPLDAEVLQDTLCRAFGTQVKYQSDVPEPFSYYPGTMRTVELSDGTVSSPFLQTFGRPSRDTGFESDRSRSVTEEQRLFFINSTAVNGWITQSWLLRALPFDSELRETSLQYLWLNMLSRYPTSKELRNAERLLDNPPGSQHEAVCDLMWMLLNTKEFSTRH